MEENKSKRKVDSGALRQELGYPVYQIAKALTAVEQHEDPETRERAKQRVSKWVGVINGILSGTLDVGSRTPLKGVPAWATLEVVTGGFATGELVAGGPLVEHEQTLLAELGIASDADGRRVLNAYHLTDDGIGHLQELLRSGCYDVTIPEEGALLVVAWFAQYGFVEEARRLLEELQQWFPELRFYPVPADRPRQFGSRVYLQDVGATIESLRRIQPNQRILAQKEAIRVWAPTYDLIVGLFLETVEGAVPDLRVGTDGKWIRSSTGRFPVEGGWPCRHYPEGWNVRAQQLLDQFNEDRQRHRLCGNPERSKGSLAQLHKYLQRCVLKPKSLNGRDVGRIRMLLARYVSKRGTPDSTRCRELRLRQAAQVSAVTHVEIAQVVTARLSDHPLDGGIDDVRPVTQPVTAEEAELWGVPTGTVIPPSLVETVQRCLRETTDVLVEKGVITSAETLARVLPQMTAEIQASGITDPALRQLYAAIYRAFRRRRSLLLVNLERQVQIGELPWVAAIDQFRLDSISARELARQTLAEVVVLAITSFPQAIFPNKLLQELRSLVKTADLDLPLVDEVAADIFMGDFTAKYLQAAELTGELLDDTLYSWYYAIDFGEVRNSREVIQQRSTWLQRLTGAPSPKSTNSLVKLCESRAGVSYSFWSPANNGMIIEQQQILTSQNLAVLYGGLNLADALGGKLQDLATRCFSWICRRLQVKAVNWHAHLIQVKNSAYAWRQMVFFLALLPSGDVDEFLGWAEDHLNAQPVQFRRRFRPALLGLALAARGESVDGLEARRSGAIRFLGWSKEEHWLLAGFPRD